MVTRRWRRPVLKGGSVHTSRKLPSGNAGSTAMFSPRMTRSPSLTRSRWQVPRTPVLGGGLLRWLLRAGQLAGDLLRRGPAHVAHQADLLPHPDQHPRQVDLAPVGPWNADVGKTWWLWCQASPRDGMASTQLLVDRS